MPLRQERVERAKCVDLLSPQFEKDGMDNMTNLPASAYLRLLIQACISDITNGSLDEGKIQAADRVARVMLPPPSRCSPSPSPPPSFLLPSCLRVEIDPYADLVLSTNPKLPPWGEQSISNITKDGKEHDLQLCSFIQAAGALVEGRSGDVALIAEHSAKCEAALGPSDSLSALGRLLEATALVRAGKEEEARAVLDKAGKGMAAKCTTVEYAGVKVEVYGMLSRLALSAGDLRVAKEAASASLQAAEAANDNSKAAASLHFSYPILGIVA